MRVTNKLRSDVSKNQLISLNEKITVLQEQISSSKKILHPSDDPVIYGRNVQMTSEKNMNTQYKRNLDRLSTFAGTYETVFGSMKDLLSTAKQLAVTQSSDQMDATSRKTAAVQIEGIIENLVTLGNTKVGNTYAFGGKRSDTAAFVLDETDYSVAFHGSDNVPEVYVDGSTKEKLGMSGKSAFYDGNTVSVFGALKELKDALENNDGDAIRTAMGSINKALDLTANNVAYIGTYSSTITTLTTQNSTKGDLLTTTMSDMVDADMIQLVVEFNTLSNAYQAATSSLSTIMKLSILNYM
ncbi:MAG: flagellar hook-associated protein FlgL [Proteobacteria bacterium]|nr:flagellar hook-associated protein FlgL [Pseudomonadota bacterium]